MRFIFNFLAIAAGVYSLFIFIRIIISWFGGSVSGKPVDLLTRVTDPYLDWWRRALNLRIGFLDLSPIAGIAFLSLIQNVFSNLARFGRVTIGNIAAVVLLSIWLVAEFILGFCLIILVLRLIAYLTNRNIYSPFWRVIDSVSQPMLYRINRIILGKRITGYLKGIIIASLVLVAIWIGGGFAVQWLAGLLAKLPL